MMSINVKYNILWLSCSIQYIIYIQYRRKIYIYKQINNFHMDIWSLHVCFLCELFDYVLLLLNTRICHMGILHLHACFLYELLECLLLLQNTRICLHKNIFSLWISSLWYLRLIADIVVYSYSSHEYGIPTGVTSFSTIKNFLIYKRTKYLSII